MSRTRLHKERGFNLIESIIAMAMLSFVILAIVTLYYLGQRNVYSGKQMTQAISVGTSVIEDLSAMNRRAVFDGLFKIADTATGQTAGFTVADQSYTGSRFRTTNVGWSGVSGYTQGDSTIQRTGADTPKGPAILDRWRNLLGSSLTQGSLSVVLTPVEDPINPLAPQFATATVLRMRVIIQWREGQRSRNLVLDTVKPF